MNPSLIEQLPHENSETLVSLRPSPAHFSAKKYGLGHQTMLMSWNDNKELCACNWEIPYLHRKILMVP